MKRKYLLPKGTLAFNNYPIWEGYERALTVTTRWTGYVEKNPKLRLQTVSMHTVSSLFSSFSAILQLLPYASYDLGLMLAAIELHDYPEGRGKKDVLLHLKTDEKDLAEYLFFHKKFKHFPALTYATMERAYLLQFASRCPECFPKTAKMVMKKLQKSKRLEVYLFPALESFEYLFYGYEQYLEHGDEITLTHVLRNQLKSLRELTPKLPGFREEVFTPKYEEWVVAFLEDHKHIPNQ